MRYITFFIAVCALAWAAADVRPQSTTVRARESAGAPPSISGSSLLIPVVGISQEQLKNTFNENRGSGRTHHAIDILAPYGSPVIATIDGRIRKLFTSKAGGITIYQTDDAEERIYYYAHLDRYADGLHEGKSVSRGDVIGYVGTSGNAPRTTPHLHFAIMILPPTKEWWKGEAIDPYPLLKGNAGATTRASALR
jgi:murein DD-endopeptidase MepM/ murein hydrolase activator NlpD